MTRRDMLRTCAGGIGAVALNSLLQDKAFASNGLAQPHFGARAKNVIFLYMDGGPSQVDLFDHKPLLTEHAGKDPHQAIGNLAPTQFDNVGTVMAPPWPLRQHGDCGHWFSDILPNIAQHADDIAFVHSMTSKFPEHTSANYFLHTGSGLQGRPSMGAWVGYGLGSVNQNLPGFVVLNGGLIPPGGLDNFNSGFLPATYQASIFKSGDQPVANIIPRENPPALQRAKLDLLSQLDGDSLNRLSHDPQVEAAIENYETAYRMQAAVPELLDLRGESEITKRMYGFDAEWKGTQTYARQCLLARRLVERGVRFIEITCPAGNGDRWDQHGNLKDGHGKNCKSVDQPIGALLTDLKARGLLDDTLVIWAGEFGRTPFAQGSNGRDHNQFAFSVWLAGGGIKGGASYGKTDDWGYRAVDNRLEVHDLHATMLHLLGIEHTRSTFRYGGRDMRLTDVHGHVIHDILA